MLNDLIDKLKSYIQAHNSPTLAGKILYETTVSHIGQDLVSDVDADVACAATVNKLCELAFGEPAGGGASTYWLYFSLKNHRGFTPISQPLAGDIIISYTGEPGSGQNGISNGHTGVMLDSENIASNTSATGRLEQNFTLTRWRQRYEIKGKYRVYFFRPVFDY